MLTSSTVLGFGDGLEFTSEEMPGASDQRTASTMNGSYPFSGYRPDRPERFSRKVFVGGLPPDIDEGIISSIYKQLYH